MNAALTGWKAGLVSILGGLAVVPVAIALGIAISYGILYLRRVSEHEGRRGFLAILYGIIVGAPLGFYGGFTLAQSCLGTESVWQRATLSGLASLLGSSITIVATFIGGYRLAEARRGTNYAGERGAWALFYFTLPITLIVAATLFAATWFWLARFQP
jgi:hypothetical protein